MQVEGTERIQNNSGRFFGKLYTGCLTLNGSKIKHYILKMKADMKVCTSNLQVFFLPPHLVKVVF